MSSQPLLTLEALEKQLVMLIRERLLETPEGFGPESNLYDHGLDSMAIMQLLVLVENEFGVVIPEVDLTLQNLSSSRLLAGLIIERRVRAA